MFLLAAAGCGSESSRPLVWRYRLDESGQVAATTDPAGRTVAVGHRTGSSATDGLVEYAGPTGSVTYTWDEHGRPASATGPAGTTKYRFDDQHRLVRMATDEAPALELAYDGHGRPAVVRIGGLQHAGYEYDFLGRLTVMDTPAGRVEFRYGRYKDETTFQSRTLPNGVVTTWKFDSSGRLVSLRHVGPDETSIASYTCEYDAAGRLAKLVESIGGAHRGLAYSYDAGQRLAGVAIDAGRRWAYRYDPIGGRVASHDTDGNETAARFDWAGRLVEHGGRKVRHDGLGSIVALGGPAHDAFEYAADGRLIAARRGDRRVTYVHDADGQLVARRTATSAVRWVCSPLSDIFEPLAAVGEDGSRTFYLWDRGRPLGAVRYGHVEFFLSDPLGSIRVVADERGAVAATRDFDPFGMPLGAAMDETPRPGFAGMFYDPVAAVYLTPQRAYDPELGQFLQRDPVHMTPLGSIQDLSPYAYCGNDPVNLIDHSGARAARPRDRYAGYDPGSRAVADRWNARVAAGTASRSRTIQGNRMRTTYYDENGDTQAWAAQNDPDSGPWIDQQWRRAYVRARDSVEGLSREYAELVDRVGVIAAQQDPLASMLLNARQRMDQFGPPPPELLPRPVAGEANDGVPTFRAYDSNTGEVIRLGCYGEQRPRATAAGSRSTEPQADTAAGGGSSGGGAAGASGGAEPVIDWVGGTPTPAADPIVMSINDVVGGVAVPRRPPVDPDVSDFVGGVPTPRAGSDGAAAAPGPQAPRSPRSDLADFADWAVGRYAGKPPRRSDLSDFMDLVDGMSGARVPAVVTLDPPDYTPRGRPKSDLQRFRESLFGPTGGTGLEDVRGAADVDEGMSIVLTDPDTPAAVGGVWLGGAAAALPDMGPLAGVAEDGNGRLVLLSHDDTRVDLPPLRIDDIVTIFRCIYEHGQSPSVSIDNDPKNPNGPRCTVRHGPGTAETYVGWILFQCDRVLKCYTKGFDNFTGKPFRTRVPGFKNESQVQLEIEARDPSSRSKPGDLEWRRIWIMPASVSRERSGMGSLTLLDVPLKLSTKYREIKDGEFQDVDRIPDNSWGRANAIVDRWFTEHYDEVAAEFVLDPPAETGITKPVQIFTELKRIATVAAVAEALAAEGVPMPEWMRTYPVRPCPVDKTDPWLRNVEVPIRMPDGSAATRKVDGGVDLTPPDDLVKTVPESPRATAAEEPVNRLVATAPALTPVEVATSERRYRAVAVPGANTMDLGSARLAELDVAVPFGRGQRLELVRRYNSFFAPQGPWGRAWSLDLPTLDTFNERLKKDADGIVTISRFRLASPLGSVFTIFRESAVVPELGGIRGLVPDRSDFALAVLGTESESRLGAVTRRVALRDGSIWHFHSLNDKKPATTDPRVGLLAGIARGPYLVAYRWDSDRRLTRIEGFDGRSPAATIDLAYDAEGRVATAVGKSGSRESRASYGYEGGALEAVTTRGATRRYEYREGLVSSVRAGDRPVASFEYGPGGKLRAVSRPDGSRVEYRVTSAADGPRVETVITGSSGRRSTLVAAFDNGLQERERTLGDGTVISTETLSGGAGSKTTLTLPDGSKIVEQASGDGRRKQFSMPSGKHYAKEYDPATRTVTLSSGSTVLVRQTSREDGGIDALAFEGLALRPVYDDDNRLTGTMVTGPERRQSYSEWLEVAYDAMGRPVQVTDNKGRKDRIERAEDGRTATIVSDGRTTKITADATDRIVTVSTSTKDVGRMAFDAEGRPATVSLDRDGKRAEIEFSAGRPARGRGFDGGETTYAYITTGPAKGRLERLTYPHGLVVQYAYDDRGRLRTATLGDVRRYRYERDASGNLLSFAVEPLD